FDFVAAASDADVAGDVVNARVAFCELGGTVRANVVHFDVAGLSGDAYRAGQPGDRNVSMTGVGGERRALGEMYVEILGDAAVVHFLIYGMTTISVARLFDHLSQRFQKFLSG